MWRGVSRQNAGGSRARVTGIDLSPSLIDQARAKGPRGRIDYQVADLSQPLPNAVGSFGAAASYLVLNDVADYRGFAATFGAVQAGGLRLTRLADMPTLAGSLKTKTAGEPPGARPPLAGLRDGLR